ncbi:condensation domain-containing protein, partial [Dactylosporangium sp. NPDC051485]|uniref:condensation domain-containing protein n=1 Tax=Dactylosporangium sp. NPDC051485 TaxID=3154846 RepID=UPI003448A5D1
PPTTTTTNPDTIENTLTTIWQQTLHLNHINPYDNFLDLGGDSLAAIRVAALARTRGIVLPAHAVLRADSLAALAERARRIPDCGSRTPPVTVADRPSGAGVEVPLLPMQHAFFGRRRPDPNWANLAGLFLLPGESLDVARLRGALVATSGRHEALRVRFQRVGDRWSQQLGADPAVALDVAPPIAGAMSAQDVARSAGEWQRSLDITAGPLVRLVIMPGSVTGAQALIVAHHLIMDGWSWQLFLDDLASAYADPDSFAASNSAATVPYSTWATLLAERAGDAQSAAEAGYWSDLPLSEVTPVPRDRPDGANTAGLAESVVRRLDTTATARLAGSTLGGRRVTALEMLITAFAAAYRRWTGAGLQALRVLHHGRDAMPDVDATRTVGWLAADYPLVLETLIDEPSKLLSAVRDQMRAVPRSGCGYGVLRHLGPDIMTRARLQAQPTPEVNFNYLGSQDTLGPDPGRWTTVPETVPGRFSPDESRGSVLQIRAVVHRQRLSLDLQYSRAIHQRQTVEALADGFVDAVHGILAQAETPPTGSR